MVKTTRNTAAYANGQEISQKITEKGWCLETDEVFRTHLMKLWEIQEGLCACQFTSGLPIRKAIAITPNSGD
jgi:hypothetical protein